MAIIGGGIAGLTAAWYAAAKGMRVAVFEKGHVGGEQSSRAFGWICNLGLDPIKLELTNHSKHLWRELSIALGAEAIGYKECGLIHACTDMNVLSHEEQWLAAARNVADIDARLLDSKELQSLLPGNTSRLAGGIYQASDARVEPAKLMHALTNAARAKGILIFEQCAVRGVETSGGKVSHVVTEKGSVRCASAVLAGGAWSRLFCGNRNIYLPQLKIHSSLLRIHPLEGGPDKCVAADGYAFRRDPDGGYVFGPDHGHAALVTPDSFILAKAFLPALISQRNILKLRFGREFIEELRYKKKWAMDERTPFELVRTSRADPDTALNMKTLKNAAKAFPVFEKAIVREQWAGLIDAVPDSVPVISDVPGTPGLFMSTGFSAFGITMAPAAGHVIAQWIAGDKPGIDVHPYRLSRFTDGSRLRVAA